MVAQEVDMLRSDKTMQVSRTLLLVFAGFTGLLSSGCAARYYGRGYSRAYVQYSEPVVYASAPVVFVDAPELVYVEPGVYVVRNYNDTVYYSDGYYWSSRGGVWYHTAHWSDPWVTVNVGYVPRVFVHRDHRAYVHYHGAVGAATYRQPARTYHSASASVSAHAGPNPPPQQGHHASGSAGAAVHSNDRVVRSGPDAASRPDSRPVNRGDHHSSSSAQQPASRADSQPAPSNRSHVPQAQPVVDRQPQQADAPQPSRSSASRPKQRSSQSTPTRSSSKKSNKR